MKPHKSKNPTFWGKPKMGLFLVKNFGIWKNKVEKRVISWDLQETQMVLVLQILLYKHDLTHIFVHFTA